jgi:predicted permease
VHDLLSDLRFGARLLARHKAFTAVAALSLAAGIGLNTTMFSVVNAVMLRGTQVADPGRLVEIYSSASPEYPHLTSSYLDYLDIRESVDALSDVAAHAMVRGIMASAGRPELVMGEVVTANYFDLLGVPPALGRGFLQEEDEGEGAHPVMVLSHGLWQRRFGGRREVVGETVRLSDVTYDVVGVAPPGFTGLLPGFRPEFWVPTTMVERLSFSGIQSTTDDPTGDTRLARRGQRWLFVKGRLAAGKSVEQVQAQLDTLFARLARDYPKSNEKTRATALPGSSVRFHPLLDRYIKAASAALLVAVALVLTIACANVANMMLARGAARSREFAVRAALGAGRGRLVRQLLGESLALAALGGGLGVALAFWAGRLLSGLRADLPLPLEFSYSLDGRVLAYAALVSLATALVSGLAPALAASRPDLVPALKADATGASSERRGRLVRSSLVVAQLATSLVLLVAGALLLRGLLSARDTKLGFDPKPISSISFNPAMNGYDLARTTALRDRVLERLRALPGVAGVALASRLPLAPDINMEGVRVPGHHGPGGDPTPIDAVSVGPSYFEALQIQIVRGRAFTDADREGSQKVAIVNEALARKYWPGGDALGQPIYLGDYGKDPHVVVGISRDHKVRSVGEDPLPYLHTAELQSPSRSVNLVVRTSAPAPAALPMLRKAILEVEPEIVFTEDATAESVVATTLTPTRVGAALLGAFGALALLLAAIGLYGVISYSVERHTREVGIRMALGARPSAVLAHVLGQGLRLAAVGIGVGVVAAAAVAQVLQSLLYGVSALDPVAYAFAGAVLLAVAFAANVIPAWRAARTDPMRALRYE